MVKVRWTPCTTYGLRSEVIVKVEIATPGGPLAILPPGKTIVTIGLKQL